jgi:hypothetical protein
MAVTPVATLPAWSLQSLDTQQVGRFHDNAFLTQFATTPNSLTRAGVIPSVMTGGQAVPVDLFVSATGSGLGIQTNPGNAVIAGSGSPTSLRGPYVASSTSVVTQVLDPANATNPRIDVVYYQTIDGTPGAGDAGTTGSYIGVVTGTPAASPTVPALPSIGVVIPLAQIRVAANATTSAGLTFTDVRKSAGPSPRFLLPGDALSDPGFRYGEQRQRRLGTYAIGGSDQIVTDYWGFDNAWHGCKPLPLPIGQIATNSSTWVQNSDTKFFTLTIPDPGWAYYILLAARVNRQNISGGGYATLNCHSTSSVAGPVMLTNTEGTNGAFGFDTAVNGDVWNGAVDTPFSGASTICVSGFTGQTGLLPTGSQQCTAIVMPL